jgi:hypothetical protein
MYLPTACPLIRRFHESIVVVMATDSIGRWQFNNIIAATILYPL